MTKLEERLAHIKKAKEYQDKKEYDRTAVGRNKLNEAMNKFEELKPRIKAVLILGYTCIKNGFFERLRSWHLTGADGKLKFISSNSYNVNHCEDTLNYIGFSYQNWHGETRYVFADTFGIKETDYTNGRKIVYEGATLKDIKDMFIKEPDSDIIEQFVKDFPEFERKVFKVIDTLETEPETTETLEGVE